MSCNTKNYIFYDCSSLSLASYFFFLFFLFFFFFFCSVAASVAGTSTGVPWAWQLGSRHFTSCLLLEPRNFSKILEFYEIIFWGDSLGGLDSRKSWLLFSSCFSAEPIEIGSMILPVWLCILLTTTSLSSPISKTSSESSELSAVLSSHLVLTSMSLYMLLSSVTYWTLSSSAVLLPHAHLMDWNPLDFSF